MRARNLAALATVLLCGAAFAAQPATTAAPSLEAGFQNPPNSARPRVWWHWMNGNITKDGVRKDIEWMARVGIGGLQAFDAQLLTPQVVDKRLAYMTPEWKDAFHYAAELADQHGLELATASSPGWSETGGPWVPPKDAMKKLVWSETLVEGGRPFAGKLAPLPEVTGPFQSLPMTAGLNPLHDAGGPPPSFHGEAAVLAYRLTDNAAALPTPRVTDGRGAALDGALLLDDDPKTVVSIARTSLDEPAYIQLDYGTPQTVRSVSLFTPSAITMVGGAPFSAALEVQEGADWRKVADLPLSNVPTTASFAPTTGAHFRLAMTPAPGGAGVASLGGGVPGMAMDFKLPPPAKSIRVAELRLSAEPRVNAFEMKAGFSIASDYYALDGGVGPDLEGVAPASVIDLTDHLAADGGLIWTPPPGRWKVLRFGYSLEGTTNHPATREATGLEVDKYDGDAVRRYMETYLATYKDTTGPALFGAHGLKALVTDSTEVGPSNWTPDMVAQFKRLRGYDLRPWMPALAGVVVGSRADSDAFLYDFRRTLADLHASQHYGTVAEVAHANGLTLYGEALEDHRPVLGDDMTMRSHTDIPMSALWTYSPATGPKPTYLADTKGAASVAHIYGQNLVAAESLTASLSPWYFAPWNLKRFIDLEFDQGVNRPVIHTSVHQPLDDKVPGLALFIFGQYFNRLESWAELARPWIDYMARSSFLLQQGRNVADVGYFFGEEAPLTSLYGDKPVADAPVHYAYDFVDADALVGQLKSEGGELVTPGGARYRVLYLGGTSRRMTLPVLKTLAAVVEAGATVVGDAPQGSPSLNENGADYRALVRRLWSGQAVTKIGKGRVFAGHDVEAALQAVGDAPDFALVKAAPDADVRFVHRRLADGDIYFVNNRKDRPEMLEARFRVSGKAPEVWRADTGSMEPVSYRMEGDHTVAQLQLLAEDAVFLVFRKPARAPAVTVAERPWSTLAAVEGPWTVEFQPGRAAPPSITLDRLQSFTESADPGVKYFSGIATYRKIFTLPAGVKSGVVALDLGQVADIAEVLVNGKSVGYAWKAPYRVDMSSAAHPGTNSLEVRVADRWVNRLIGDAQPGAKKITYTTLPTYKADAPLTPAGLLGPVTVETR